MLEKIEGKKARLTFCAGAGTVTGANFLLEVAGQKILIDCGLVQSSKLADDFNWEPFPYDAKEIDILFITHGHVDHIGRIPKLIAEGFHGRILSTIPTKDITALMLEDTAGILKSDYEYGLDKIYTHENIAKAMSLWETFEYRKSYNLAPDLDFFLKDSGHILGSAIIEFTAFGKKIVFTGDLGNSPSPILPDTDPITDADYLLMESVYGDRNHESRDERKKRLESIIEDNYKRGGVLVVPTFSLERSQEMLFEINDFVENERIPKMPIYFDSPLGIKLTAIYAKYKDYFNKAAQDVIAKGDDIFMFPGLHVTLSTDESKQILREPNPKIIMAGSGMSSGGRVVHHERHYLPDAKNTLLLIGYQSLGTLGRHIEDGAKTVHISGEEVAVRAHVEKISGYSGHKDSDHLVEFVEGTAETVKKVFVTMGEPKSSFALAQRLRDYLGIDAVAPEVGTSVELDLN